MPAHFPACYVKMPTSVEHRRAAFYLASEEYIAQELPANDYLFSWQTAPTVVMGRNQVAHQEVDLDFCQREGIDVIRRKSGGGAIFSDDHNLMWSLITGKEAVETLFAEYAQSMADALKALGADVEVSGRNDIVLKGKGKVCGNAFYHLPERNIVHGTMLFDTDARKMQGALHPDASKLEARGVKSVRSRVALLKDCLSISIQELQHRLCSLLCNRSIELSDKDIRQIKEIEKAYYNPAYLYGQNATIDFSYETRIEGCGTLALHFKLHGTMISHVMLTGDFFDMGNANIIFKETFIGIPFTAESLSQAISKHHPERSVRHLSTAQLLSLLEIKQ